MIKIILVNEIMTTIEGTIFDIKKYAIHDGPGIRTTVFLKGCPLDCWWCHNPERRNPDIETIKIKNSKNTGIISTKKEESFGRRVSVNEVMKEIMKDEIFYNESNGGVTFSGGEPMMQFDFLLSLIKSCKNKGLSTVIDTCGYAPTENFKKISEWTDIFLYDIKIIDNNTHKKYTGVTNELILENLKQLINNGEKVQIRIPLIPGITDSNENLESIAQFLDTLKNIDEIRLLPYNKLGEYKIKKFNRTERLGKLPTQTDKEINRKCKPFESHGYKVKIGG